MKNPYIAGLDSQVPDPALRTTEQLLHLSGKNLGNFMFCSSVRRFVVTQTRTRKQGIDLEVVARECDGIIIPAANWLQPKSDFSAMAAQIEQANVPTVILGLGAQAANNGQIPELKPGMVRFVKAIADRCDSISVRGPFSAEVLNHYGIKNVTVTGCPSLLWHLNHSAMVKRLPPPGQVTRIVTAATLPNLPEVPKVDDKRMRLARLMLGESIRNGYDHVAQAEISMIQASRGELPATDPAWAFLRHAFGGATKAQLAKYLSSQVRAFANVPEWMVYLANKDFVLGTRLHGVIAALLAGTPAMLVTHDSRTEEMAKFAAIPSVSGHELLETGKIDPEALLARADFAAFNKRQKDYFRDFRSYLDSNGVPHRLTKI